MRETDDSRNMARLSSGGAGNPGDAAEPVTGVDARGAVEERSSTPLEYHSNARASNSAVDQRSTSGDSHLCVEVGCGRVFGSARGLTQHRRVAHPVAHNQQRESAEPRGRSGRLWQLDEDYRLADLELEYQRELEAGGTRLSQAQLNSRLAASLGSHRSAEAVKKRRQRNEHSELLVARSVVPEAPVVGVEGANPRSLASGSDSPNSPRPHSAHWTRGFDFLWDCAIPQIASLLEEYPRLSDTSSTLIDIDEQKLSNAFGNWLKESFGSNNRKDSRVTRAAGRKPQTHRTKRQGTSSIHCPSAEISTSRAPPKGGRGKRANPEGNPMTRRQRRARRRIEIQRSFQENPWTTAKRILNAEFTVEACKARWMNSGVKAIPQGVIDYWKDSFSVGELGEPRGLQDPPQSVPAELICGPIDSSEVKVSLDRTKDNSPGPDGIKLEGLRRVGEETWAAWFSLFLLARKVPAQLRTGCVSLLPKREIATEGKHFRPVTVTSKVLRLFHSILAARLGRNVDLPSFQRGFRNFDGCADNVWMTREFLRNSVEELNPLALAVVDMANAFGAVFHETIWLACEQLGVPTLLTEYLKNLYGDFTVVLKDDPTQCETAVRKGVLQGDPLSSVLFNYVMFLISSRLNCQHVGVSVPNGLDDTVTIQSLQYADDAILVSRTRAGLKSLFEAFRREAAKAGLLVNASKCVTLSIEKTRKSKAAYICTEPFLTAGNEVVPALNAGETFKYLGVEVGGCRRRDVEFECAAFDRDLDLIVRSGMDPHQKLWIIRNYLVSKSSHRLVLSGLGSVGLRKIDVAVRRAVRTIVHLPLDAPIGLFYAKAQDGGLGIPNFEQKILLWRRKRLERAPWRFDSARAVLNAWPKTLERWRKQTKHRKLPGSTNCVEHQRTYDEYWRDRLWESVDCAGLRGCTESKVSSQWVTHFNPGLTGSEYVRMLHVRFGCLMTPTRRQRMRRGQPGDSGLLGNCPKCRNVRGNLGHCLQSCWATHGLRVIRHDRALDHLERSILRTSGGFKRVIREPTIPNPGDTSCRETCLKPDLVIVTGSNILVVDPTIVADAGVGENHLEKAKVEKERKYDRPWVRSWIETECSLAPSSGCFEVIGLPVSWRGIVHPRAWAEVRSKLNLHPRTVNWFLARVLVGGWKTWYTYMNQII